MSLNKSHCIAECEEIIQLKAEVIRLNKLLKGNNVYECPDCGSGLVVLTTKNLKICDCGYKVEHKLKKGQKSLLVKGLIGE